MNNMQTVLAMPARKRPARQHGLLARLGASLVNEKGRDPMAGVHLPAHVEKRLAAIRPWVEI
ncbi:hypothetical protein SAMN05216548_102212 [Faunimonas pinastri]|uniref:Uncharacterized protein n=1 Tax=Faunimonas pinastri TaxID=1855383 RepID=A0A1H9CR25_9HYPH|nr:hypothetical protein [Faunimonas pinastri]SEQ03043.1 hypothetical protein SAMN05216548_102212 [Faunimonas pinastri]